MKERPILFNGEMVRAILEGRKTQTRRVIKPSQGMGIHVAKDGYYWIPEEYIGEHEPNCSSIKLKCPFGQPGDRLWVRETFQPLWKDNSEPGDYETGEGYQCKYPATDQIVEYYDEWNERVTSACKPSIHMPRWASRITLEITDVRVERVQEISIRDAIEEGFKDKYPIDSKNHPVESMSYAIGGFKQLWDSINANRGFGWDKNPWVWVIEFKKI